MKMDLFIQTLTGTVFELRVSPFETILSIKGKIQGLEGIPISQQHLIWKSINLQDDLCLHDYGIQNSATLTLVLAMRDGPINMRKVSIGEPEFEEIEEYMEMKRDEIWNKLMNKDKQVTLLVFRDGDQFNFFQLYDQIDDNSSAGSNSAESMRNQCDKNPCKSAVLENENTKDKVLLLKERMAALKVKKEKLANENFKSQEHIKRPLDSEFVKRTSLHQDHQPDKNCPIFPPYSDIGKPSTSSDRQLFERNNSEMLGKTFEKLPRISSSSKVSVLRNSSGNITSGKNKRTILKPLSLFDKMHGQVALDKYANDGKKLNYMELEKGWRDGNRLPELVSSNEIESASVKSIVSPNSGFGRKLKNIRPWSNEQSKFKKKTGLDTEASPGLSNERMIPPSLKGKQKLRCLMCTKKLGLSTTYQCRCGGKFCAQHRYSEAHGCTFDYKAEGRKYLQKNNPVVRASKLPKI